MANSKSACKYAESEPDAMGMFWCNKYNRMVDGRERPSCDGYEGV